MDENESVISAEDIGAAGAAEESGGEAAAPGSVRESEPERDFSGEVSALLTAFPDMAGKSLPDEVIRECVGNGAPLVRAYAAYRERGAAGSMDALRGGAGSAFRAPVRAASVGAPVSYAPADPFLEGLNAY